MKTNYTLKNFRVFDKKGAIIELAPLTFLVGCNSSGKSSIVKSLTLLKTLFKKNISEQKPIIGSKLDFSIVPNNLLGSFKNVLHSSSRGKEFSFSYKVHSDYIHDDVTISLVFEEGELGNAIVSSITIYGKDDSVLIDARHGKTVSGNLAPLKEGFAHYLIATKFRDEVKALLPPDPYYTLSEKSKKKIDELECEALLHCPSEYLERIYQSESIESCDIDCYAKAALDKFIGTGIMRYFSVFDKMSALTTSSDISAFLKLKVKEGEYHDTLLEVIDYICGDYKRSGFSSFLSYYRSLEDKSMFAFDSVNRRSIIDDHLNSNLFSLKEDTVFNLIPIFAEDRTKIGQCGSKFQTVFSLLSTISEDEPYSYMVDPHGFGVEFQRTFPLYDKVFNEYVNMFCKEVLNRDITEGIEYISSSRIQVRRLYTMEDRNDFSVAVKRYFETKSRFMQLDPPIVLNVMKEDDPTEANEVKVSDFVPGSFINKWLQYYKIGHHISLELDKNGLGLLLMVYNSETDKKGTLLADLGHGITQLFSILLQIEQMIMSAYFDKYQNLVTTKSQKSAGGTHLISSFDPALSPRTLAIEEPEIHLHPRYQSLLAEMFYEAYKEYNIQFIIETHSEYLLRKIQTLIGAKKLGPDEVSMVYVEDDDEVIKGVPKVRRIPIKADGRLEAPFGPGFYDEADNLSMELFTKMDE